MTHEIGPQWEHLCEHRWTTTKFVEVKDGWTHYMECTKCGARRTIIHTDVDQRTKRVTAYATA